MTDDRGEQTWGEIDEVRGSNSEGGKEEEGYTRWTNKIKEAK